MIDEEFDFENRLMSGTYTPEDNETDYSLRPKSLDDYVGQEKPKKIFEYILMLPKEEAIR